MCLWCVENISRRFFYLCCRDYFIIILFRDGSGRNEHRGATVEVELMVCEWENAFQTIAQRFRNQSNHCQIIHRYVVPGICPSVSSGFSLFLSKIIGGGKGYPDAPTHVRTVSWALSPEVVVWKSFCPHMPINFPGVCSRGNPLLKCVLGHSSVCSYWESPPEDQNSPGSGATYDKQLVTHTVSWGWHFLKEFHHPVVTKTSSGFFPCFLAANDCTIANTSLRDLANPILEQPIKIFTGSFSSWSLR